MLDYQPHPGPFSRERLQELALTIMSDDFTPEHWGVFMTALHIYWEQVEDDPLLATLFHLAERIDTLTRDDSACRGSALSCELGLSRRDQDKHLRNVALAAIVAAYMDMHNLKRDAVIHPDSEFYALFDERRLPKYSGSTLKRAHKKYAKTFNGEAGAESLQFWLDTLVGHELTQSVTETS